MKLLSFITLFLFFSVPVFGQDTQEIETRIQNLIGKTSGYKNIYTILQLITWENEIIFNIPCVPPFHPADYKDLPISSFYGIRFHPIDHEYKHHQGIDIPLQIGDTICSTGNGVVLENDYDTKLGNYIVISHSYGFQSIYGHLQKSLIEVGDSVKIGFPIAISGNSGVGTGPHLHYSIKKNENYENPYNYCFLLLEYLQDRIE